MLQTMLLFSTRLAPTHRHASRSALRLIEFCLAVLLLAPEGAAALEVVKIGPPIKRGGSLTPKLSHDGGILIGSNGLLSAITDGEAALWSREAGHRSLGTLPGHNVSEGFDVSANGSVVVGNSRLRLEIGPLTSSDTFLWTEATGMTGLGFYAPNPRISEDGSTIVGTISGGGGFRWRGGHGTLGLGMPEGALRSNVRDVSSDGEVVAVNAIGWNDAIGSEVTWPLLWTAEHGYRGLGLLPAGWQTAAVLQVSDDGKNLLGQGGPVGGSMTPFLWSQEKGFLSLPIPEGAVGEELLSMTSDASIVVGSYATGSSPNVVRVPFVWDARHGTRELMQVLIEDHGPAESFFHRVSGISGDGTTLLVSRADSNYDLWVIYLDKPLVTPIPEPASCLLAMAGVAAVAAIQRRHSA